MDVDKNQSGRGGVTVSHVLGEITWLISQSARHAAFRVTDLGWFAMPAIPLRQFHLFRKGERPVGAAIWAFPPSAAEEKLSAAPLSPDNRLEENEWVGGDRLWLVDLIAPFATTENRQIEVMLGDLMTGPFKAKEFRLLGIDSASDRRSPVVVDAGAGARLVEQIASTMQGRW